MNRREAIVRGTAAMLGAAFGFLHTKPEPGPWMSGGAGTIKIGDRPLMNITSWSFEVGEIDKR